MKYELDDIYMIVGYHGPRGIAVVFMDRVYYCSCGFKGEWK